MKQLLIGIGGIVMMVWLACLAGCGQSDDLRLVNLQEYPLTGVQQISISYGNDDLLFLQGEGDSLVLKEYMNEDKRSYYAKATEAGADLSITHGTRPRASFFQCYVEVYLPSGYAGGLTIHTSSGDVHCEPALSLSRLRVTSSSGDLQFAALETNDCYLESTSGLIYLGELRGSGQAGLRLRSTSGKIRLGTVEVGQTELRTTSAAVEIESLRGHLDYESTSGSLLLHDLAGGGRFHSTSGSIEVACSSLADNITAYSKSQALIFRLPPEPGYRLLASTKSGQVDLPAGYSWQEVEGQYSGEVGQPLWQVELTTGSGKIEVW